MVLSHCCSSRWLSAPGARGDAPASTRLCQPRFLGSWREHFGCAERWCQGQSHLECSRNADVRQLCLKLGTFAYEDIAGVIQFSDRKQKVSHVGAVAVAGMLTGLRTNAARQWSATVIAKNCSAALPQGKCQIKLAVGNSGTELAVGNPETDLTALPDTLPVVADVADTSSWIGTNDDPWM